MSINKLAVSRHFNVDEVSEGLYACIHQPGGAAFSNAGIVDLGDRTIVVDAFDTLAAARDLRQAAETLLDRPVDTVVLTHPHSDHWMGAPAFDADAAIWASEITRQVSMEWGRNIMEDFKNPEEWEAWVQEMQAQFESEQDGSVRDSLESSITHTRYVIAEMDEYQPRYADRTFEDVVTFQGSQRKAEFRSLGRGHSEDDAVLLLTQDQVAFIGDIGFFDTQPFLGYCDLDGYREQLRFFLDSDYRVLVPGHGPVGNNQDEVVLQLEYMDVMEDLIGEVAQRGGSFREAMQISLPEPFCRWLVGGMGRFESNVRYLFAHFGGEVPEEG